VKVIVLGVFVAAVVKLKQFVISEPDKVHHRSRAAIQQLSAPVAARPCLYSRHIMTSALHQASKEYITNHHILSKYFELEFLQLQLVKILCKLIII